MLTFFGVAPGMRVLDLNSATGYFTEILARSVGPTGHVVAHNHTGAKSILGENAISARYVNGRLPNVVPMYARHDELAFAAATFDLALLSLVYHDTYWHAAGADWGPVDRPALLAALRAALAPGGIVGIVDHHAHSGANPVESVHLTHRIDRAIVLRDFEAAGFVFDAESAALGNPNDDRTRSVFDPSINGKTDRFVLRFRRP